MKKAQALAAFLALVAGGGAGAAPPDREPPPPPLYEALVQCRSIAGDGPRLACLDAALTALEGARQQRAIVVIDRGQIKEAKRTLFGLTIPRLDILSGDGTRKDEVDRVDGVIASSARDADGRWTLRLADGARWLQIDDRVVARAPRAGDPVAISRAAMGSFMMQIRSRPGFRVRRVS